jgi:hypothetical protein
MDASTREWMTFLPTNTTSRKWLATPLGHDATLTKSRSDVSRPMDAFRIVDAKLLNRASLHRLFRCAPTSWLPTRSPRAAPIFRVLRPRFASSSMPSCSTGFTSPYKHTWRGLAAVFALTRLEGFGLPYNHTWCVAAAVFASTRLEGFTSPYKHIRDEFIGAERADMTSYKSEQTCRDDFIPNEDLFLHTTT